MGTLDRLDISTRPQDTQVWMPMGILQGLAATVLLTSCMNLGNMMLAFGSARRKEIAIRLAVGGTSTSRSPKACSRTKILSAGCCSTARIRAPSTRGPMIIVGLAPAVRHGLYKNRPEAHIYVPSGTVDSTRMFVYARAAAPQTGDAIVTSVREQLRAADANLSETFVKSFRAQHEGTTVPAPLDAEGGRTKRSHSLNELREAGDRPGNGSTSRRRRTAEPAFQHLVREDMEKRGLWREPLHHRLIGRT